MPTFSCLQWPNLLPPFKLLSLFVSPHLLRLLILSPLSWPCLTLRGLFTLFSSLCPLHFARLVAVSVVSSFIFIWARSPTHFKQAISTGSESVIFSPVHSGSRASWDGENVGVKSEWLTLLQWEPLTIPWARNLTFILATPLEQLRGQQQKTGVVLSNSQRWKCVKLEYKAGFWLQHSLVGKNGFKY